MASQSETSIWVRGKPRAPSARLPLTLNRRQAFDFDLSPHFGLRPAGRGYHAPSPLEFRRLLVELKFLGSAAVHLITKTFRRRHFR